MYSVVLMMAMTGGGDVPAGLFHNGCNGGCTGSCYGSCMGSKHSFGHSCNGGCMGSKHSFGHSCNGGCFGSCTGKHSGMFGHGCNGCNGGCYGSCYGGCTGGHKLFSHKSHGCNGGCYGSSCYGTPVNCCGAAPVSYGCVGGTVVPTTIAPPLAPTTNPTPKKTSLDNAAPATLVVNVPANARLTIDGEVTTSTSTQRVFVSPTLNAGRDYHYTLKAEFVKDGKTVTVSKEVAVQAGNETSVTLDAENLAGVASR